MRGIYLTLLALSTAATISCRPSRAPEPPRPDASTPSVQSEPSNPIPSEAASVPGAPLVGIWQPAPENIVDMAATHDRLFLAEAPESGAPLRVHVGSWQGDAWRWGPSWEVPTPAAEPDRDWSGTSAAIGVFERGDVVEVALNRIEFQGGSHGIAFATLTGAEWAPSGEISSPTDSDIHFGTPVVLRDDQLITASCEEEIWQYRRDAGVWSGQPFALPDDGTTMCGIDIAASADGSAFGVGFSTDEEEFQLAWYQRNNDGAFQPHSYGPMPASVTTLAMAGERLVAGFSHPLDSGEVAWVLNTPPSWPLTPTRRISVPPPADGPYGHLATVRANERWIVLTSIDSAWATSAAIESGLQELVLERSAATRHLRPSAVVVGDLAVLLVDGRIGTFALQPSPRDGR